MLIPLLFWSLAMAQDGAATLLKEADDLFFAGKRVEAFEKYRRAAEAAEKEGSRSAQVEALAQVARSFSLIGKLEEGRPWLERAAALAKAEDPLGWSRYLGVRGIFERESGDKARAKATFVEMHRYCVEKKLDRRALDALHHVAIVVPVEEQPEWALKGIAVAERLKDDSWLAVLWNNLGATYEDLKQYDQMMEAYLKARDYHHASGTLKHKMIADWTVGHAYRLLKKYPEAETWLRKTLPQAVELHAKEAQPWTAEWVGWCKNDLGLTLIARGDKAGGLALLKEARAALVEAVLEKSWPEGLKKVDEEIEKAR
jgi:tetratricopeptide (TPR) repeat protein